MNQPYNLCGCLCHNENINCYCECQKLSSKDERIEKLERKIEVMENIENSHSNSITHCRDGIEKCLDQIDQCHREIVQSRCNLLGWIDIKEQIPGKDGRYLVVEDHHANWVGISSLRNGKFDMTVKYWMELPKVP